MPRFYPCDLASSAQAATSADISPGLPRGADVVALILQSTGNPFWPSVAHVRHSWAFICRRRTRCGWRTH